MIFMFSGVILSIANYDALLAGWSKLELQSGVPFTASNSKYCNRSARNVLINPPNSWGISDGGPATNCPLAFERIIPDQSYTVNTIVSEILPPAFGGTVPRSYALTGDIPLGLDFTTATLTLAGTPTATAAAVTLTYTVTDSATPSATATLTFTVTINKGEQTSFVFPDATVNKIIEEDSSTFTVTVTGGSGDGAVTYESDDTAVATVGADSGEVSIVAIGITTITATKAADTNYNEATATYTLTVNPALTFGTASIADQTYNVGSTVTLSLPLATGGTGDLNYDLTPIPNGLRFTTTTATPMLTGIPSTATTAVILTYTVTDSATPTPATAALTFMVTVNKGEQTSFVFPDTTVRRTTEDTDPFILPSDSPGTGLVTYVSSDTRVATVDANGQVIIVGIGITTITATKVADPNYNKATATYTLTVNLAPLVFDTSMISTPNSAYTYNVGSTVTLSLPPAIGGLGDLDYDLTPIPDGLTFTTATLTLAGTPTAAMTTVTLTYKVTDSNTPTATATLTFTVTVNKGEQTSFVFPDATVNKIIEEDSSTFTVTATGGSGDGAVTYESDDTAVATVVADSGEVSIVAIGTTTITATKATDANYNEATAQYTLTVNYALTFGTASIADQTYNVGSTVTLSLPLATGGTGDLNYDLTPIPNGLRFTTTTATPMLTGIPSTATTAVILTYTVTDSATPTPATAALTFTVTVLSGAFITTWQIEPGSENDRSITIPIHADSSYRYTVNWGDDSEDTTIYTSTILATHIYPDVAAATSYKVTITGEFPRVYFNNGEDKDKIISIDQWGNNTWDSMESAFWGCSNLRYNATDTPDLSQVTDMSHMFQGAALFNGDIGDWDVDNVTDMSNMFAEAAIFNGDIGGWDVSNVADMSNMFANAALFNGNIGDWEDKVGQVTDMSFMFQSAFAFNQNISQWKVNNVTDMSFMFEAASAFDQNISQWEVDKVTDMNSMFSGATEFNQDIGGWEVGEVTDMSSMFEFALMFDQNISQWEVDKVTDMNSMFFDASVFNQNIGGWKVGEVIDMSFMFSGATEFNQDISLWEVGNVTDMSFMFSGATEFNQDIGGWDVGEVIDMAEMFFDASQFDQNIGDWDVSKVEDMFDMFFGATLSIANYDALLAGWSMLTLRSDLEFHAGDSQYCNQPAHDVLTDPSSNFWDINDDGLATNCPLTFYMDIPDQLYTVGQNVLLELPIATHGIGDLSYTLMPEANIPVGLRFDDVALMLTGIPSTTATAVTLTYRVIDNGAVLPMPTTAELSFMVTVDKGEQTSFVFADTTVRKTIEDTDPFRVIPNDDPGIGLGTGLVTYVSSDTAVATVSNDGDVTIQGIIGETTITATKAGDANYNEATATYTLTVTAAALIFRIKAFLEGAQ